MSNPPKRRRTGLRSFHHDYVPVEDNETHDFIHAREIGLQRKGNRTRFSAQPRVTERASGTDPWLKALKSSFWPTPDNTEFALDANADMYNQTLEGDVMEDLDRFQEPDKKKRKKPSKVSVSHLLMLEFCLLNHV